MDAVADSDLASSWAGGRSGFVSLDEGFGAASDAGLQEDRARDAVWSGRIARPSLAALLAEAGVASEEQLRIAVAEGMGSGERLGEVVLRRGWIDEAGLARVLARQWGLAFLDDEAVAVDPAAAALVPLEQGGHLGAFAIGFSEGLPVIALAGRCSLSREQVSAAGLLAAYELSSVEPDPAAWMRDAGRLLEELAADVVPRHLGA